jgi:hypothetical protein
MPMKRRRRNANLGSGAANAQPLPQQILGLPPSRVSAD